MLDNLALGAEVDAMKRINSLVERAPSTTRDISWSTSKRSSRRHLHWREMEGSCNWLAANFSSFDVSIRLRDPALVGELIRKLAGLARGRPGIWHQLAVEMTVLGRRVEQMRRGNGRTVPTRILYSPDHAKLLVEARIVREDAFLCSVIG
jgi:hypothetical protein